MYIFIGEEGWKRSLEHGAVGGGGELDAHAVWRGGHVQLVGLEGGGSRLPGQRGVARYLA